VVLPCCYDDVCVSTNLLKKKKNRKTWGGLVAFPNLVHYYVFRYTREDGCGKLFLQLKQPFSLPYVWAIDWIKCSRCKEAKIPIPRGCPIIWSYLSHAWIPRDAEGKIYVYIFLYTCILYIVGQNTFDKTITCSLLFQNSSSVQRVKCRVFWSIKSTQTKLNALQKIIHWFNRMKRTVILDNFVGLCYKCQRQPQLLA